MYLDGTGQSTQSSDVVIDVSIKVGVLLVLAL